MDPAVRSAFSPFEGPLLVLPTVAFTEMIDRHHHDINLLRFKNAVENIKKISMNRKIRPQCCVSAVTAKHLD